MVDRVVRDGQVAVLVSPGHGAGCYSWNEQFGEALLFCPEIVAAIEAGADEVALEEIAERLFPGGDWGGLAELEVQWVPQGCVFRIHKYDGSESIEMREDVAWVVA